MSDGRIIIDTLLDSHGIENGLGKLGGIAGVALKGVGLAVAGVGTALLGIGGYAVKVGSDFEAGMSKVKAISGASAEDMVKLSNKAKEMGATTKFSATESAEALKYMSMAGWKTNDMLSGLPGIMNLAAASGENLGAVSDIVTDALTAFGMKAKDSGHFADVLAQASSNSNTNVAMLGESFKYVAPLAGSLGYSAEDTSIALGLMANSGIKASQSGTSLKTALVNMVKPTDKMKTVMDQYGLSLTNVDGTMKPLKTVMDELRTKMGGLDKATQANAAATLFGKESLAGMLSVINASPADYKKLTDSIYNADGAAEKMAKTMNDNLQGKIVLLKSALEGLGIQIYEKMKKPLTDAAETAIVSLSKLSKSLTSGDLADSVDKIALGFANLMKCIAEGVVTWLPRIITAFAWIMDNGIGIATIIGGITAAIIAFKVGAIITGVIASWQQAKLAMALYSMSAGGATIAQGVMNGVFTIWETLVALFTGKITLATAATALWTKAQVALSAVMKANLIGIILVAIVALVAATIYLWKTNEGFRNAIIGIWKSISDFFVGIWDGIIGFFTKTIPAAFNSFIAIVSELPGKIGAFFTNIYDGFITWGASVIDWVTTTIPQIINNIITFFTELPGKVATVFTDVINKIIEWGTNVITWVTTTVPQIIESILTFFNELPAKLGDALGFALGAIIKWGLDTWNYLVTNVPIWINAVVTFFSELPGKIWTWLVNAYTKIVTWGSQVYSNMSTTISNAITAVVTFFSQLPGKIYTWLTNAISKIVTWGSQMYSKMTSAASNAINAVINWFAQLPGRIWSWLLNTISKVAQFAINLRSKAREAGSNMVSGIMNVVTSLPGKMADIGANIVKGVWNGIAGSIGWIGNKISEFCSGVVAGFKKGMDIHSPSKIMRDIIGKNIVKGIGVGIDVETPNLQKDIDSNLNNLTNKMKGTVDYETARTTAKVVAYQNYKTEGTTATDESNKKNNNQTFIAKLIVDGKEFTQTVVAPHQAVLNDFYKGR
ncbi:phage tail tape measure protein [Clostridium estertheticum]|uniref:phage tail tape measure protein n=1 Tax=Clostridium estertheticum TaxID=238834 RepID=UPI0013EE7E04|nr:phage tail tape measure protein [Clostridium estertheticum]MBZ9608629.1 phage tail tape measure protein [Clostridium estertheticum]